MCTFALLICSVVQLSAQSKGYSSPEEAVKAGLKEELKEYFILSELNSSAQDMALNIFLMQDNPSKVLSCSRELSSAGYAIGDYGLGWCYEGGEGVAFDQEKAFKYFQKAATAKVPFPLAYRSLGYHYSNGDGTIKNEKEAYKWFTKGASDISMKQYKSDCLRCMANMRLNGEGVSQSESEAFRLYCESANLYPNPKSSYMAGVLTLQGVGTSQNEVQAMVWLEKAAKLGHPNAQLIFGLYLIDRKNQKAEGEKWIMRAASNGNTDAMMYFQESK